MKTVLKLAALVLILSTIGIAQTAILLPDPHPQFFDVNGNPLAGGKIFTFLAGTAIAQPTYTDSTAATLNSNPIVLDSAGFPSCAGSSCGVYLTNGISYRIVVQNSLGVQQWVADNVKLVNSAQVGGANTQVQYNCAGAFCGSPNFTWNNGSQTLTVTALAVNAGGTLTGSFGGNPIFTGTVTFSGTVSFTAITSTCANAASAGFLKLCRTDQINWRNAANLADEGLSTDASDTLNVSHANGIVVTGANPAIRLGGITNAFPAITPVGTQLRVRLADGSADASLSASTLSYNGPGGPTFSGACVSGQVETATSSTSVSCQTPSAAGQIISLTTNSGTAIGAGATTWITKAITMPAVGCPCRVIASYALMFTAAGSGTATAWIEDGANVFGTNNGLTNTAGAGNHSMGISASTISPVTYTNGTIVTFTGRAATDAGAGITSAGGANVSAQNSWLSLVVITSN